MRGDRFRQCPPPRRWDLCPIPKISDIFQRASGTTGSATTSDDSPRLPSRSSLLVRLTPGMRNSTISRGTPRGPRDTWTLEDEDNENGGSPDEASEVRRLPRPREEARIVFREREGIELSSLEIIWLSSSMRSRGLNRAYVISTILRGIIQINYSRCEIYFTSDNYLHLHINLSILLSYFLT